MSLRRSVLILAAAFLFAHGAVAEEGLSGQPLDQHMVEHFVKAVEVQTALIHADLEAARAPARWLARHEISDSLPGGSDSQMATVQVEAEKIAGAVELTQAAEAAGRMAAACGECHAAMEVRTGLDSHVELNPGPGLVDRMARHLWAADRMWEGLIAPSEASWQAGAEALMEAPLTAEQVTGGVDPRVDRIGGQVRSLAEQAHNAASVEDQAALYGQFLARCGECHTL